MKCYRILFSLLLIPTLSRADPLPLASAINTTGAKLLSLTTTETTKNNVLSPYSIQSAMLLTHHGASGETRSELARALSLEESLDVAPQLAALNKAITASATHASEKDRSIEWHNVARLFGQKQYQFKQSFLSSMRSDFHAPLELLDFKRQFEAARLKINEWASTETHTRIKDLIPFGGISASTRMVLANTLYFKAPWQEAFNEKVTRPERFTLPTGERKNIAMMRGYDNCTYEAIKDGVKARLPYRGGEFALEITLPSRTASATELAQQMQTDISNNNFADGRCSLSMPRFTVHAPTISLRETFEQLGVKTAFDIPKGSADFSNIVERSPDTYLYISEIFHQTYLAVNEEGTEAAAATTVVMADGAGMMTTPPREITVNKPFSIILRHIPSGVALFVGVVTEPGNDDER